MVHIGSNIQGFARTEAGRKHTSSGRLFSV